MLSQSKAYNSTAFYYVGAQMFGEVFSREHQLIRADPRNHTYLACGLLVRGAATISDINRNVARIKPTLKMVHWNNEVGRQTSVC